MRTRLNFDEIRLIQKRFELMTIARYRDRTRMKKASEEIDRIRMKIKPSGRSTTEILREWRDKRYGPSGS
jgi:hypothetical protein